MRGRGARVTPNETKSRVWGWSRLFFSLLAMAFVTLTGCAQSSSTTETEDVASSSEALTATIVSIALTPPATSIPATVAQQLKATATLSNGKTKALTAGVTWSVSNTAVATVTPAGLVTAMTPGTVTVMATDSGVSGTATLTVTTATLASVSVSPASKKIPALNTTFLFKATGVFSDGTKYPLSTGITWASSSTAVATVAPSGTVTSVGAGTTAI